MLGLVVVFVIFYSVVYIEGFFVFLVDKMSVFWVFGGFES